MFTVFLEIIYERQLRKIDFNRVINFIDLIKKEALLNGSSFFQVQTGLCFYFKKESAAYAFSVARFLFNLNKILIKHKNEISEVRCITDYYEEESIEFLADSLASYKKSLIPEFGIFAKKEASAKLSKYIDFEAIDTSIFMCTKFKFFENVNVSANGNASKKTIILHRNDSYFWALYNFILANPLSDKSLEKMSNEDKDALMATKNIYVYLKKYRFLKDMPQYFIDAFLINSGIYLENYIKYQNNNNPIEVLIDNIKDKKNSDEVEKIYALNKSISIRSLDSVLPSIYHIPDDLLELIYIILSSSKYFFYDEINEFLLSLNKSMEFFNDIYSWMYSEGIILMENNIYSVPYGLLEIIERRIAANKNTIDRYIAEFLWKKYKYGVLDANSETEKIFDCLNFKRKPDFLIASLLHSCSDDIIEGLDLKKYKNEAFYDGLKYYQNAIHANIDDSVSKSYALLKTAIVFFQENKFDAGEFRAFSLLAFFNLAENKISDALTYFSYALDNAEHAHDTSFICDSLFNISVVYFLQNNLKQSITFLDKLSKAIDEYFEQKWKIPYLFMKGRVYLRTGEFDQAVESFKTASEFARIYFEKLEPLCNVWYGRALLHNGQIKNSQDVFIKYLDSTDDAALFLLESFLFYPILKDDFEKMNIDMQSLYDEYVNSSHSDFESLKSGFSFVEDLIWYKIYNMPIGKKIFNAFYSYYCCKMNFSKMYDSEKCKIFLSELETSAIESLYQNDPFSSLYLYLCYDLSVLIYGETASQTIAYLSKAFKAMQKNVLAIGENDIRDKYMQHNLWNSRLFKVAKNQKLI